MDSTVVITGLVLAAVVAVAVAFMMRRRGLRHVGINLPKGSIEVDAAAPRGASIKGAVSHGGSVVALDRTGQGAAIENVEAKRDVIARVTNAGDDPKA